MLGSTGALAAAAFLLVAPPADARLRDSDRDGLSNRFEKRRSFTSPRRADTDRDGLRDRFEVQTSRTNPRVKDTDRDGLTDRAEVRRFGTNPLLFDTDRDGMGDGLEILLGRNPLTPDDTTAPDTTIGSGPSGTVASGSASFSFSSTETGSTFECRLDSAGWTACSSPQSYSGLANATHSFAVRARDQAGNTDATPATRDWTVNVPPPPPPDTTAPDTTIGSGPSGTVASGSASFSFSSTETGSTFECRLDSAGWTACSSPQSYSGLANATHSFAVRARDQAGNTDATPATRDWTVNVPPPPSSGEPGPIAGLGYQQTFRDDFGTLNRAVWDDHIWYDETPSSAWTGFQEVDANGILHLRTSRNFFWGSGPNDNYPINTVTTQSSGKTFKYGYFEARMKWSGGRGAWPGFWLLSYRHATNPSWPSVNPICSQLGEPVSHCYAGELDVFEGQGSEPQRSTARFTATRAAATASAASRTATTGSLRAPTSRPASTPTGCCGPRRR